MAIPAAALSIGVGAMTKLTKTVGAALTGEKAQKVLEEIQNVVQEEAMQFINGETFKQRERKLTATIENLSGFDLEYVEDNFSHGRYWQHPEPLIKHGKTATFTICERDRSILIGVSMAQRWKIKPTAAVVSKDKEAQAVGSEEKEAVAQTVEALCAELAQLRASVVAMRAEKEAQEAQLSEDIYLDVHLKAPFFGYYGMECVFRKKLVNSEGKKIDLPVLECGKVPSGESLKDSPKLFHLDSKSKHGICVSWARDMDTVKIVLMSVQGDLLLKAAKVKADNKATAAAADAQEVKLAEAKSPRHLNVMHLDELEQANKE